MSGSEENHVISELEGKIIVGANVDNGEISLRISESWNIIIYNDVQIYKGHQLLEVYDLSALKGQPLNGAIINIGISVEFKVGHKYIIYVLLGDNHWYGPEALVIRGPSHEIMSVN